MSEGQKSENKNLAYYCQCFANLNIHSTRQRGDAHYKPILLLSVIDSIASGVINENKIYVSDDLLKTFNNYWSVLGSESYKGGLYYPFIHLQREGFWHIKPRAGFNGPKPKTTNKLKEAVEYASLDRELFNILQEPNYRAELIDTLVATWFSSNKRAIEDILQVNQDFIDLAKNGLPIPETANNFDREPKFYLRKFAVRNAFFRKAVVHIYDYRCAFCRLKVMRTLTQNIVDGSHIKPFAQFYDNQVDNGISLCKNHHWAFDRGWFAIDDDYRIIVTNDLEEQSPNAKPMKDFQRERILLPASEKYLPRLDSLQWHRQNVFKA
jgi:putative restriction endonuclease